MRDNDIDVWTNLTFLNENGDNKESFDIGNEKMNHTVYGYNEDGLMTSMKVIHRKTMEKSDYSEVLYDDQGRVVLIDSPYNIRKFRYLEDRKIQITKAKNGPFYLRQEVDIETGNILNRFTQGYRTILEPNDDLGQHTMVDVLYKEYEVMNSDFSRRVLLTKYVDRKTKEIIKSKKPKKTIEIVRYSRERDPFSYIDENLVSSTIVTCNDNKEFRTENKYFKFEFDNEIFFFVVTKFISGTKSEAYQSHLKYYKVDNQGNGTFLELVNIGSPLDRVLSLENITREQISQIIHKEFKIGNRIELIKTGIGNKYVIIEFFYNNIGDQMSPFGTCGIYEIPTNQTEVQKYLCNIQEKIDTTGLLLEYDFQITDDIDLIDKSMSFKSNDNNLKITSIQTLGTDLPDYSMNISYKIPISGDLKIEYDIDETNYREYLLLDSKTIKTENISGAKCKYYLDTFKENLIGSENSKYAEELQNMKELLELYIKDNTVLFKGVTDLKYYF